MTVLTEKWKKGELPSGWYYVQLQEGVYADNVKSIIMDYYTEFCDFMKHPYLIESVLALVPSYNEYQQLLSDQLAKNEGIEINAELEAENTKLKELLKECRENIEVTGYNEFGKAILLNKINEVSGEE